jgi:hypothetical protein
MVFDFSVPQQLTIDMCEYVKTMLDEFTVKLGSNDFKKYPAPPNLFDTDDGDVLRGEKAEEFHSVVAKGLFVSKRARPDIITADALLCTRVSNPTLGDWDKLLHLMKFLNRTQDDKLVLGCEDIRKVHWFVDASFATHPDGKSHSGAMMTFGRGAVQSISMKQRINTKSSTEAELVAPFDVSSPMLWTRLFLEAQDYGPEEYRLHQDNKATILMETNGKASCTKRTRAMNIRYFYLKDQIEKKRISVEYCPTRCMVADYMTKPLQGKTCLLFMDVVMGRRCLSDVFHQSTRSVLEDTVPSPSLMGRGISPRALSKPNPNIRTRDFKDENYYAILSE